MKNYKIRVTNEAESREAQELFFELGYKWCDTQNQTLMKFDNTCWYSAFEDGDLCCDDYDENVRHRDLTLPQLRDLVVLHRNSIDDATHTYHLNETGETLRGWLSSDNWYFLFTGGMWQKQISADHESAKKFMPIQKEQLKQPDSQLISGADALRALADDKQIQYKFINNDCFMDFVNDLNHPSARLQAVDFLNDFALFRLKPRTITINGIEVPAPFQPKVGEAYYSIMPCNDSGWQGDLHGYSADRSENWVQFGAWRSEDEIKQVVVALRKVFEVKA